jgi:hypothetical protein
MVGWQCGAASQQEDRAALRVHRAEKRPIMRSDRTDGGPLRYRVVHTASLWKAGERPVLLQRVIEGDPVGRSETLWDA